MTPSTPGTKILLCAQYLRAGQGGIAAVASMSARALGEIHQVNAIACMDPHDFSCDNVPVKAFAGSRARFLWHIATEGRRATHLIHDFAGTARAQQLLAGSSRPHAVWVHGSEAWRNPPSKYVSAIHRADLVLVNSQHTLDRAATTLKGAKRVRLCPLATANDEIPALIGPQDGPPTVLLLGRMDEDFAKGHDLLIAMWPRIVAAVPQARLLLAGGGPAQARARALAAASPAAAAIEFTGFVADADMEALWQRASVFAMPGFEEGFGLVYAEAMRRGIPVLASREDAGQEVNLDGVSGFNVSRQAPAQMADALIALLRDRDLAARMGRAGHLRWQEHYRYSQFRERLLAATQDFLSA